MDHYQIISDNFQRTIETIALSVDTLAPHLAKASEILVTTLLGDHKIICCGNGVDGALAQVFCCNLLSRFEQERPALPALALSSDATSITAIAHGAGLNETYSRQIRALGQPGDTLLCISSAGDTTSLLRAIQAAHERDMAVVALSSDRAAELDSLLQQEDVLIQVSCARRTGTVELHIMILHCLCELIETSLFGPFNQE